MMGVERRTDNNNVITNSNSNSNMRARGSSTPSSPSSTSSPSTRPRRSKGVASPSQMTSGGGGVAVSTGPKSAYVARTSVGGTRPVVATPQPQQPQQGLGKAVEDGEAVKRIPTAGIHRHSLLSGDTRLLNVRNTISCVSRATTAPVRRAARETERKTSPVCGSHSPSASRRLLTKRRSSTDVATTNASSSSAARDKVTAKSAVPVKRVGVSSSDRRRPSLASTGGSSSKVATSDGASPASLTRQLEHQRRHLRLDPAAAGRVMAPSGTTSSRRDTANTATPGRAEPPPSHIPGSTGRHPGATRTSAAGVSARGGAGAGAGRAGGQAAAATATGGGGSGGVGAASRDITALTPSSTTPLPPSDISSSTTDNHHSPSTKSTNASSTSISTSVSIISTRLSTSIIPTVRRNLSAVASSSAHSPSGGS